MHNKLCALALTDLPSINVRMEDIWAMMRQETRPYRIKKLAVTML